MSRAEIREVIDHFLRLIKTPSQDEAKSLSFLEFALDYLAYARHCAVDDFVDGYPDPPTQDYAHFRQLAAAQFPRLGFYDLPQPGGGRNSTTTSYTGDALDDLADIACDLAKVQWCWDHTCTEDALWHFCFSYETHWGKHLRNLQWYLEAIKSPNHSFPLTPP